MTVAALSCSRSRRAVRIAVAALIATLAGCQSYAPDPLRSPSDILAPPVVAAMSADAAAIDRPYLKPQSIDLDRPLTPDALAIIAVLANPDLKALRARTGVVDAQAFAARLLPDPTFSASFDQRLSGPDPSNGFGGSLGLDLNQLRTAQATRAGNAARQRQVRLDLAWAEWQTAGQARLQAVRVSTLAAQLILARASTASAERQFAVVARAAGRGDLAAGEVDTRRQAALDAGGRVRTLEAGLVAARGELNRQLGLSPDTVVPIAPVPPPAPPPGADALVATALARRLDLAALRAGYAAGEADLRKAVLEQSPNLNLTLSGARDTANNYTAGPGVGFTLPLWNRNRGAIAVARATRAQLKAEYEARLFQTRSEIAAAVAGLAMVRRQRADLVAQLPALERYAAATVRAAARGDLAPATATTAEQTLRDRRSALLQLDQQAAEQTIALELLVGSLSEGWAG